MFFVREGVKTRREKLTIKKLTPASFQMIADTASSFGVTLSKWEDASTLAGDESPVVTELRSYAEQHLEFLQSELDEFGATTVVSPDEVLKANFRSQSGTHNPQVIAQSCLGPIQNLLLLRTCVDIAVGEFTRENISKVLAAVSKVTGDKKQVHPEFAY